MQKLICCFIILYQNGWTSEFKRSFVFRADLNNISKSIFYITEIRNINCPKYHIISCFFFKILRHSFNEKLDSLWRKLYISVICNVHIERNMNKFSFFNIEIQVEPEGVTTVFTGIPSIPVYKELIPVIPWFIYRF